LSRTATTYHENSAASILPLLTLVRYSIFRLLGNPTALGPVTFTPKRRYAQGIMVSVFSAGGVKKAVG